jgi:hypothetical protein
VTENKLFDVIFWGWMVCRQPKASDRVEVSRETRLEMSAT